MLDTIFSIITIPTTLLGDFLAYSIESFMNMLTALLSLALGVLAIGVITYTHNLEEKRAKFYHRKSRNTFSKHNATSFYTNRK